MAASLNRHHSSIVYNVILFVYICLYLENCPTIRCEERISQGSRYYNRDGVYVPSNPAGYQTYVYKDRRYGYQPSYLDPVYRGPTRAPEDRYLYGVSFVTFRNNLYFFFFFFFFFGSFVFFLFIYTSRFHYFIMRFHCLLTSYDRLEALMVRTVSSVFQ